MISVEASIHKQERTAVALEEMVRNVDGQRAIVDLLLNAATMIREGNENPDDGPVFLGTEEQKRQLALIRQRMDEVDAGEPI